MDSFEWNKVSAAVLVGVLLYVGINIISESVFHEPELEKSAYIVEGLDNGEAAPVEAVVEEGPSFSELLATASAERGERVFRRCQTCHTAEKDGPNKVGPNLWGIVGHERGKRPGFGYSTALETVGGVWDYDHLNDYLANPSAAVPGNKMSFAGLRKDNERADVVEYLRSLSDDPVPLP